MTALVPELRGKRKKQIKERRDAAHGMLHGVRLLSNIEAEVNLGKCLPCPHHTVVNVHKGKWT